MLPITARLGANSQVPLGVASEGVEAEVVINAVSSQNVLIIHHDVAKCHKTHFLSSPRRDLWSRLPSIRAGSVKTEGSVVVEESPLSTFGERPSMQILLPLRSDEPDGRFYCQENFISATRHDHEKKSQFNVITLGSRAFPRLRLTHLPPTSSMGKRPCVIHGPDGCAVTDRDCAVSHISAQKCWIFLDS